MTAKNAKTLTQIKMKHKIICVTWNKINLNWKVLK